MGLQPHVFLFWTGRPLSLTSGNIKNRLNPGWGDRRSLYILNKTYTNPNGGSECGGASCGAWFFG